MTQDEIIRMAREAGLFTHKDVQPEILAFANLIAAHKEEVITAEAYRCGYKDGMKAGSVICDNVAQKYQYAHNPSKENVADECAAAIRAEREACAELARKIGDATEPDDWALDKCQDIESAIRARGAT